jgi:bifunctional oligoribonuclease and PAP phosphatase NrnA
MEKLEFIASYIMSKKNFILLGHIDPDGDCIGSLFSLKWGLDKLGKSSIVYLYNPPEDQYDYLSINIKDYKLFDDCDITILKKKEMNIISLDSADRKRLGEVFDLFNKIYIINIDHHIDNTLYGDLNYVNSKNAAAGEIIYELLNILNVDIDERIGTAIATAIIADTGSFRYENTSPHTMKVITNLMEKGIDIYRINKYLFGTYTYNSIKLKGLALSQLQLSDNNKIAWLIVESSMLKETNSDINDAGKLVNYARDIKGVEVGLLFLEKDKKKIKVSLRSNFFCNVNEIAAKFGGGGHPRASGCLIEEDLETAINMVLNEVKKSV